jgi:uncharacterized repeat protein (TIGR01451 family)
MAFPKLLPLFSFLFLLLLTPAVGEGTLPQYTIYNQAEAIYSDSDGNSYTIYSNAVGVQVLPVAQISLFAPDQIGVAGNEYFYIPITITNTGNTPLDLNFSVSVEGDPVQELSLYWDKNQNGIVDPGEEQISETHLEVLDSIPLVVKGLVDDQFYSTDLNFTAEGDYNLSETLLIPITRAEEELRLRKSVDKFEASNLETLHYRLDFQNLTSSPLTPVEVNISKDGTTSTDYGILIVDELNDSLELNTSSIEFAPVDSVLLYRGREDSSWKEDPAEVEGELQEIGLLVHQLEGDQEGRLEFDAQITADANQDIPNWGVAYFSDKNITSNLVVTKLVSRYQIVVDDTDDNGSYTGTNSPYDPDDSMSVENVVPGQWVTFVNEVWNLGNKPEVINIYWDLEKSRNVPPGSVVVFFGLDGNRLFDTDGDGHVDLGEIPPGTSRKFLTKICIKEDVTNGIFAIAGVDAAGNRDWTFDIINREGSLELKKSVDKTEAYWGDTLYYTLDFKNTGLFELTPIEVQVDQNNDGEPEVLSGILLDDKIDTSKLELLNGGYKKEPADGILLFKGSGDQYWKLSPTDTTGTLSEIGLLIQPTLEVLEEANVTFPVRVKNGILATSVTNQGVGYSKEGNYTSNIVTTYLRLNSRCVVDDTDDGDSYRGWGVPSDPDDSMEEEGTPDEEITFLNEAWNLDQVPHTIDIIFDTTTYYGLPGGTKVWFTDQQGNPLKDSDGDGVVDLGKVAPGERVFFVTHVLIPSDSNWAFFPKAIIPIKGYFSDSSQYYDYTFDIVKLASGVLDLNKSATAEEVAPHSRLTYTIVATNSGTENLNPTPILYRDHSGEVNQTGILIWDQLPPGIEEVFNLKVTAPVRYIPLYRGSLNTQWVASRDLVEGELEGIGVLLLDGLVPDGEVHLELDLEVGGYQEECLVNQGFGLTAEGNSSSNQVVTCFTLPEIVVDDTDDGGAYTGKGVPTDPDDLMVIDRVVAGEWYYFKNEVWNFSGQPRVVELQWDPRRSENLPENVAVKFYDLEGNPLPDSDGDGNPDLKVENNSSVQFYTKVYIPSTATGENLIFAIKGFFHSNPAIYDYTFDKIGEILQNYQIRLWGRVPAGDHWTLQLIGDDENITAIESNGTIFPEPLSTTIEGFLQQQEEGVLYPFTFTLSKGGSYYIRVSDFNGTPFYLSTPISYSLFQEVPPGEERCWDWDLQPVECSDETYQIKVTATKWGTKYMDLVLAPAGLVVDGITGQPVSNGCVTLYRCSDSSCSSYTPVSATQLGLFPDLTQQQNPQLSGDQSHSLHPGEFQFLFRNWSPEIEGYYWIGVDQSCSPGKFPYDPVTLQPKEFKLEERVYDGGIFKLTQLHRGAEGIVIPLYPAAPEGLVVKKRAFSTSAFVGDFVEWEVTISNPNPIPIYDIELVDQLPEGIRWEKGTTEEDTPAQISSNGREIRWKIEKLEGGESKSFKFWSYIDLDCGSGRKVNQAYGTGWTDPGHHRQVLSNRAFAAIVIGKGILSEKGIIFGKVYIDENRNFLQDQNETGIKKVKIYLEDGRFTITDSMGKYHFDGVSAGPHVVRIDERTLPPGVKVAPPDRLERGNPKLRLIRLHPGEMVKVNFRLTLLAPTQKVEKVKFQPLQKVLKSSRGIGGVVVDPKTKKGFLVSRLELKNLTDHPLYEVKYWEKSPLKPSTGSVYLNGSPYYPPNSKKGGFQWTLPLIEPGQKVVLEWRTPIPEKGKGGERALSAALNPLGKRLKEREPLPLLFSKPAPRQFQIWLSFPEKEVQLTQSQREGLQKLVEYLRKQEYQKIVVKVGNCPDHLFQKREKEIKKFLRGLLIDPAKVEVVR